MKTKAYIKKCMLLIFLPCIIHNTLSSQEIKTAAIEADNSTYQNIPDSPDMIISEQTTDSLLVALETRSCVNTFANQTVSSYLSVYGCSNLTTQYINVINGGHLSLSAPGEVIINGMFDVLSGGALDVGIASVPTPAAFNYLYDASGNRIARQFGSARSSTEINIVNNKDMVPDPEKAKRNEPDDGVTE